MQTAVSSGSCDPTTQLTAVRQKFQKNHGNARDMIKNICGSSLHDKRSTYLLSCRTTYAGMEFSSFFAERAAFPTPRCMLRVTYYVRSWYLLRDLWGNRLMPGYFFVSPENKCASVEREKSSDGFFFAAPLSWGYFVILVNYTWWTAVLKARVCTFNGMH